MSRRLLVSLASLTLVTASCVEGPGPGIGVTHVDYERYVDEVQPIFAEHCANPSCHGTEDRPLEVYAVHRHRLDPDDVFLDAPLTSQELRLGFERTRALLVPGESASAALLVRKPLPESYGGAPHAGGVQFGDTWSEDYLTLWAWIADAEERR